MTKTNKDLSLDTHHYDGNLPKDNRLMIVLHDLKKSIPLDVKKRVCQNFIDEMGSSSSKTKTQQSLHYANILMNSWGTPANFDPTNQLGVEEILYFYAVVYQLSKGSSRDLGSGISKGDVTDTSKDMRELFHEVCDDMATGNCQQGRTTRLWQISLGYFYMYEEL